jgi:hypothetical protein
MGVYRLMFNLAAIEGVCKIVEEEDRFSDLHKPMVEVYNASPSLQHVMRRILEHIDRGDKLDVIACVLFAMQFGYKLRTVEELEELYDRR